MTETALELEPQDEPLLCLYCHKPLPESVDESTPPAWDEEAWKEAEEIHAIDCQYVNTRGFAVWKEPLANQLDDDIYER